MSIDLNFITLMRSFRDTARANARLAIAVISTLTIGNVLLDRFASPNVSMLIGNLAIFAAQVVVTRLATQRLVTEPLMPNVAGFFGLGIIGSAGVLAGLIFAILPGLYLAGRWLIAGPVMLVENNGVIAAMRRSWIATGPLAWSLSGLLLLFWTPAAIAAFGEGFLSGFFHGNESDGIAIASTLVTYLAMFAASVSSWLAAAAAFGLLCARVETLADTFA